MDTIKIARQIDLLKKRSFEGWTEDEKRGYLTACHSIEKFIEKIQEDEKRGYLTACISIKKFIEKIQADAR